MKTIVSLAFAGFCLWSVATAQISPYLTHVENGFLSQEETPLTETLNELVPSSETNNAWFPNFKVYVRDNVRYPAAARETGLEGVVVAEAVVQTDGKLTNIKITEGLSYSCDKEVARLLSGMPAWNPARRDGKTYDQKIYVRVRFQLKRF